MQLMMHRAVWGFVAMANAAMHGHIPPEFAKMAELGEHCGASLAQVRAPHRWTPLTQVARYVGSRRNTVKNTFK